MSHARLTKLTDRKREEDYNKAIHCAEIAKRLRRTNNGTFGHSQDCEDAARLLDEYAERLSENTENR